MSIWSAATTIPTISGSLGPPACAFAVAVARATPNMIVATAHKVLRRFCIRVFDLLISFDILIPPRCLVLQIVPPVQSDQRLPDKSTARNIVSFLCHNFAEPDVRHHFQRHATRQGRACESKW